MNIVAISQKGPDKTENEDRVVIGKFILADGIYQTVVSHGIIAIADGVGGNNAGAVASHFVADRLTALESVTAEVFSKINEDLLCLASDNNEYKKMATTLSGLFIDRDEAHLFSIGNTRVYSLQSGRYLKQLTIDDTTLNYLLSSGQLSPEDAETFERRNEITACFGGGASTLFKLQCKAIDPLSVPIVLTSDGIHDYVSIDQMENAISEYGMSVAACEALISDARAAGSHDDISIILGEV